eukprot:scaffold153237_cov49-Prasinocladus_malaysianus.AAC.2
MNCVSQIDPFCHLHRSGKPQPEAPKPKKTASVFAAMGVKVGTSAQDPQPPPGQRPLYVCYVGVPMSSMGFYNALYVRIFASLRFCNELQGCCELQKQ